MKSVHKAVLLQEVIGALTTGINSGLNTFWYLDGTLGGAGHAMAIADKFNGKLNIIGLDRDSKAIERARKILDAKCSKLILECTNFRNIKDVLSRHHIQGLDMILLDLGISSDELENSGKGFSFLKDEPLFMTFGDPDEYHFSARDIVNNWAEEDIANVIYAYGEERYARRISRAIIRYREKKKIETSLELAELVKISVPPPYRRGKIHPATKTFQALRIAVNDELLSLREGLKEGFDSLNKNGRMAIISFHSLEDRIVKNFFKDKEDNNQAIIPYKFISPSQEEILNNPRSRSAKLRVIYKI